MMECWGSLLFSCACVKLLRKADLKISIKKEMREEKKRSEISPGMFLNPCNDFCAFMEQSLWPDTGAELCSCHTACAAAAGAVTINT